MEMERTKINELSEFSFSQNVNIRKIYDTIKENTDIHVIKSWESLIKIAKDYWLWDWKKLVARNIILWKKLNLVFRRNNLIDVKIRVWDELFIPKDKVFFESYMNSIDNLWEIISMNEAVLTNNENSEIRSELNDIKDSVERRLYPAVRQFIWLPDIANWFIQAQKSQLYPDLPTYFVSSKANCSRTIRNILRASVNPQFISKEEKAFLAKENIDAWMLPSELIKIWYEQKFRFMDFFDKRKILSRDPIVNWWFDSYSNKIIDFWKYLQSNWVVWSLVPMFYRWSRAKENVQRYNQWKSPENYHFNTHQTLFLWNDYIEFKWSEFKDMDENWRVVNRINNSREIEEKLPIFEQKLQQINWSINDTRVEYMPQIKNRIDSDLQDVEKWISTKIDKIIRANSDKNWSNNNKELFRIKLLQYIENWEFNEIRKFKHWNELVLLVEKKNRIIKYKENVIKDLENDEIKKIRPYLNFSEQTRDLISRYNDLQENRLKEKQNIEDQIKRLKEKWWFNIVDLVASFIIQRSDQSFPGKSKIIKWMKLYHELIDISVDWKKINLKQEIEKYYKDKSSCSLILPNSIVKLWWSLMLDWYVQHNHPNSEKNWKMNSRVRFFWEYMADWDYLPTEYLEPWKDSCFRQSESQFKIDPKTWDRIWIDQKDKIVNEIWVRWVYSLQEKSDLQNFEQIIKQQILIYDKDLFNWLTPWSREYNEKLKKLYDLQIIAMKISWYYRWIYLYSHIPYFDVRDEKKIRELNARYMREKERDFNNDSTEFADMKEYLEVYILSWDNIWKIFSRIVEILESYKWVFSTYTNLENLKAFNQFQKIVFIEKFFENITFQWKDKWKNLNNLEDILKWKIVPNDKLIIRLDVLNNIIWNIANIENWTKIERNISNQDEQLISMISNNTWNENLIEWIIFRESYGWFKRKALKQILVLAKQLKENPNKIKEIASKILPLIKKYILWEWKENYQEILSFFKQFLKQNIKSLWTENKDSINWIIMQNLWKIRPIIWPTIKEIIDENKNILIEKFWLMKYNMMVISLDSTPTIPLMFWISYLENLDDKKWESLIDKIFDKLQDENFINWIFDKIEENIEKIDFEQVLWVWEMIFWESFDIENYLSSSWVSKVSSLWDLQMRFLDLKNFWNESQSKLDAQNWHWLNKDNILQAIALLKDPKYSEFMKKAKKEDLDNIEKIKSTLSKPQNQINSNDRNEVYELLSKIIRLDYDLDDFIWDLNWSRNIDSIEWENIVWKILSIHLMNKKLDWHWANITNRLITIWEDISKINDNEDSKKILNDIVLMINNKWEWSVLMALVENYIIRIFEAIFEWWLTTQSVYLSINRQDMLSSISNLMRSNISTKDFFASLRWFITSKSWKISFDKSVFIQHIWNFIQQKNQTNLTAQQSNCIKIIQNFVEQLKNSNNLSKTIFDFLNSENMLFFKWILSSKWKSISILPTNEEMKKPWFQNSYFNYVNWDWD